MRRSSSLAADLRYSRVVLLNFIEVSGGGRIAQSHRPRGGDHLASDLEALRAAGVDVLVSCLTEQDEEVWGLEREAVVAEAAGLEFIRHPIVDHDVPRSTEGTLAFAASLAGRLLHRRHAIVVHCLAGIGRSGLLTVAALVKAGWPLERALDRASAARGHSVPETRAQRAWLIRTLSGTA